MADIVLADYPRILYDAGGKEVIAWNEQDESAYAVMRYQRKCMVLHGIDEPCISLDNPIKQRGRKPKEAI